MAYSLSQLTPLHESDRQPGQIGVSAHQNQLIALTTVDDAQRQPQVWGAARALMTSGSLGTVSSPKARDIKYCQKE